MHSSRMRTVRLFSVSRSLHCDGGWRVGGGYWVRGWWVRGVCFWGLSAPEGGVCTRGVSALGEGVCSQGRGLCSLGWCLLLGGLSAPGGVCSRRVCPGGCLLQEGAVCSVLGESIPACNLADHPVNKILGTHY